MQCAVIVTREAPDAFIFNCSEEAPAPLQAIPKDKIIINPSPRQTLVWDILFSVHWKMFLVHKFMAQVQNDSQKLFQPQPQIWFHSSNSALAVKSKLGHCLAIPAWKQFFLAEISSVNLILKSHQSLVLRWRHQSECIAGLQRSNPSFLVLLWAFPQRWISLCKPFRQSSTLFWCATELPRIEHLNARRQNNRIDCPLSAFI